MENKQILAFVLTSALIVIPVGGRAADSLFDTDAATKHSEQGIALLKSKNLDAAIAEFEESAAIAPEAEAYYYLGYAYYLKAKAGNGESRQQSREYFDKAYELDPNFSPTRFKPAETIPAELQSVREPLVSPESTVTQPTSTTEPSPPQSAPSMEQPNQ